MGKRRNMGSEGGIIGGNERGRSTGLWERRERREGNGDEVE